MAVVGPTAVVGPKAVVGPNAVTRSSSEEYGRMYSVVIVLCEVCVSPLSRRRNRPYTWEGKVDDS